VRYVVWINGVPYLLPEDVEPTEEAVNESRREHMLPPLDSQWDVVDTISTIPDRPRLPEWTKRYRRTPTRNDS